MVKHQRKSVVFEITSNVKGPFEVVLCHFNHPFIVTSLLCAQGVGMHSKISGHNKRGILRVGLGRWGGTAYSRTKGSFHLPSGDCFLRVL